MGIDQLDQGRRGVSQHFKSLHTLLNVIHMKSKNRVITKKSPKKTPVQNQYKMTFERKNSYESNLTSQLWVKWETIFFKKNGKRSY